MDSELMPDRVTAVLMHRENPLAWAIMPEVQRRVRAFARQFDRAAQEAYYIDAIDKSFGAADLSCFLVAFMLADKVVGHFFATVALVVGERVGWVLQWAKDDGLPRDPEPNRIAQQMLDQWASQAQLSRLVAVPSTEGLVTAYRRFGFEDRGTLVSKELHHGR